MEILIVSKVGECKIKLGILANDNEHFEKSFSTENIVPQTVMQNIDCNIN